MWWGSVWCVALSKEHATSMFEGCGKSCNYDSTSQGIHPFDYWNWTCSYARINVNPESWMIEWLGSRCLMGKKKSEEYTVEYSLWWTRRWQVKLPAQHHEEAATILYATLPYCVLKTSCLPKPVSGERLFVTSMFSVFIPRYTVIQAHSGDAGAPPHAHAVVFFWCQVYRLSLSTACICPLRLEHLP